MKSRSAALPCGFRAAGFTFLLILLLSDGLSAGNAARAQAADNRAPLLRQMQTLEKSVSAGLHGMFAGPTLWVLAEPRSAYLDGYGVVIQTEVNLYPTSSLGAFMSPAALAQEAKAEREKKPERLKQFQGRLRELLVSQTAALTELGPDDSVAIVVHLFNPRPQPEIPNQIVIQAKRQALLDLQARGKKPAESDLVKVVSLRMF